jgi:hypothetical protein
MTLAGLPHSGIPGSTPACGSPRLIAANHALLRLSTPRHPPCALSSLTINPVGRSHGLQDEGQGSAQELRPWLFATKTLRDSHIGTTCVRVFVRLFDFQRCDDKTMEETGLEPATLGLQSRCSTN